ncbi:MAG: hypothetical protein ACJ77B_10705 [Chloroflexota bacterium]
MSRTILLAAFVAVVGAGCTGVAASATLEPTPPAALTPVPTVSAFPHPSVGPSAIPQARAIAIAKPHAAQEFAGAAKFVRASEEKEQCVPDKCGRVWFVTFSGADAKGRPMQAVVALDSATGEYEHTDVSMVPAS